MSTLALYRRARRLFNCGVASLDRHNRREWVRSVTMLGDRWLYAKTFSLRDLQSAPPSATWRAYKS